MERPANAAVRELARVDRAARWLDASEAWPEECVESERCFGTRAARLYPLVSHRLTDGTTTNENAVRTPEGVGTLHQAIGTTALVLLMKTHPVPMYRHPEKWVRPLTGFPVERVTPYENRRKVAR